MSRLSYLWIVITLFAASCATVPGADYPKRESTALAHPEATTLAREVAVKPDQSREQSGFRLLADGVDSFLVRAEMASVAERTLDIQYFILQDDETGKLLVDSLLQAAKRNVRVRLLLDDAEDVTKNPRIAALAAQPNIEVRIFNPFIMRAPLGALRYAEFLLTATRVNYRMHNKLFIADNSVAVVGGRNIGDEYFATNHATRFTDFDVLAVGPVVPQLSKVFDSYWNSELAIPFEALTGGPHGDRARSEQPAAPPPAPGAPAETEGGHGDRSAMQLAQRVASGEPLSTLLRSTDGFVRADAEVLYDTPEKREAETDGNAGPLMRRRLVAAIDGVQSELLIASPYLVPGDGGMRLLERTRARGAQVRIVTNSLEATEMPIAHVGYQHYRKRLLEDDVDLCEMRAVAGDSGQEKGAPGAHRSALHGKLFVLDRKRVFIGSMNFDRRSLRVNTEMGLLIESPRLAQDAAAHIDDLMRPANCYRPVLGPPDPLGNRSLTWRTENNGKVVELSAEPMGDLLRGFKTELLALLPIDDLL